MFRLKTALKRSCSGWSCCFRYDWDDETRSRSVGLSNWCMSSKVYQAPKHRTVASDTTRKDFTTQKWSQQHLFLLLSRQSCHILAETRCSQQVRGMAGHRSAAPDDIECIAAKVVDFCCNFSALVASPAVSMQWNEWGAVCLNMASACTYSKAAQNKCHFCHTGWLSLCFHLLPQFHHPVLTLPPPGLPTSFLPRRSLSASQHIPRAGRGVWSEPTPLSLSPFSLPLSARVSSQLLVSSPLSHRNGLHYFASSPSSKMTFSDFTKARQFDSEKLLQSEKENEKKGGAWMTSRARRSWCQV